MQKPHTSQKTRVVLAWSSDKDSAWTLHCLRQANEVEVVGLLTTFNETFDRVAMHAVRRVLVEQQAAQTEPLFLVFLYHGHAQTKTMSRRWNYQ